MADDKATARNRLLQLFAGFNGTWVLVVGRRSGLLRAVADAGDKVTEETLAERTRFHLPYVQVWCRAAFAFGFLDHEASGYRLAPHMRELLLDAGDPFFVGGRAEFYASTTEDFAAFPERLKDGRMFPRSEHAPGLLQALSEMTKPDFVNLTDAVLPKLPGALDRLAAPGARLLDVGCGAGWGLLHFARRFPSLSLTGIEPDPESVKLAQAAVSREGLASRIDVRKEDARTFADRDRYDLIVLNVSLHETGDEAAWREVLSRCREAAHTGALIVVSELPYPGSVEEYRTLPSQLLAGVQHHEALVGCGAITVPQLRGLLEGAGFSGVRVIEQPNPARVVYAATKN